MIFIILIFILLILSALYLAINLINLNLSCKHNIKGGNWTCLLCNHSNIDSSSSCTNCSGVFTSWNTSEYMPLFDQYREQYTDNISEFYEKINTYFTNISINDVIHRKESFINLVNSYTSQLAILLHTRLTVENTCNILLIGAIDGVIIQVSYIKKIVKSRNKNISIYINPLMSDGGNGYTIGISFLPKTL